MKALIHTVTFTLSMAFLGACATGQYAGQEYDDMYYSSADREFANEAARQREAERLRAQEEQQRQRAAQRNNMYDERDAGSARQVNPDAVDDQYYGEEYAEGDYYVEESYAGNNGGQAPVINNYYGNSFQDPWMYNPYGMGMGMNPYGMGMAPMGMGMGMSPWGMGMPMRSGFSMSVGFGFGYGRGFYDPFYDPYWGTPWGFNSWGMHNPYARGYRHGFYDGYYRSNMWGSYYNPHRVIVLSDNRRNNVRYSPRSARGSERLGVGQRAVAERMSTRSGARSTENGRVIRTRAQSPNSRQEAAPAQRRTRRSTEDRSIRQRGNERQAAPRQRQRQREAAPQQRQRQRQAAPRQQQRQRQAAPQQRQRQQAPTQQRQRSTPTYRSSPSPRSTSPSPRQSAPTRSRSRGGGMQSNAAPAQEAAPQRSTTFERSYNSRTVATTAPVMRQQRESTRKRQPASVAAPQRRETASVNNTFSRSAAQNNSVRQAAPATNYRHTAPASSRSASPASSSVSSPSRSTGSSNSGNTRSRGVSRSRGGN